MKSLNAFVLAIAAVLSVPTAHAQQPTPASVAAKLHQAYPDRPFGAVSATQIPGLYEVVTGDSLSYVDASGTYFVFGGKLVDFKHQVNITDQRLGDINRVDPAKLPLGDAIKTVKGDGKRVLYLFTDPNCPYCKRLENEDLKGVENVTIYTFLYPILNGSLEKAEHIWCAPDRQKAWADWMLRGTAPLPLACANPAQRNAELGKQLRVAGTPTMFGSDGSRLSGAVGAAAINAFLDASTAPKLAAK